MKPAPQSFVSLFAGVGGFDLALERAGYRCVGQCEIDPVARSVLERHWPDVPKHDDIQTLSAATFAYPDVVTFGSPCQGLSQAGHHLGFDDPRSGLFSEAVRYIEELLDVTNGVYPRYAIWENVVGALHSNRGADFRAALSSLIAAAVPVPESGKWAKSGLVRGAGRALVWRVLDAQHFGLAQRRPRLFAVVDLGGGCPAEVLLEREGLPGDLGSGSSEGAETSSGAGGGVVADRGLVTALTRSLGAGGPDAAHAQAGWLVPEKSRTLTTSNNRLDVSTETLLPEVIPFAMRGRDAGNVPETSPDGKVSALRASAGGSTRDMVVQPMAFDQSQITHPENRALVEPGRPHPALLATGQHRIAYHTSDGVNADPITTSEPRSWTNEGTTFRLRNVIQRDYRVRRLMPVEGDRLMGFPDGWTAWGVRDGKRKDIADTPRFRLIGNSLAIPVAQWIAARLKDAD